MEEKLHLKITSAALFKKKKKTAVIDMQKTADKCLEHPELHKNLCVICFSNVSELWSSSFHSTNNAFFHAHKKEMIYHM